MTTLDRLRAEDPALAEAVKRILPAFALRQSGAGEEITVESLLSHARLGLDHLSAPPAGAAAQTTLTYDSVAAALAARRKKPDEQSKEFFRDLFYTLSSGRLETLKTLISSPEELQRAVSQGPRTAEGFSVISGLFCDCRKASISSWHCAPDRRISSGNCWT